MFPGKLVDTLRIPASPVPGAGRWADCAQVHGPFAQSASPGVSVMRLTHNAAPVPRSLNAPLLRQIPEVPRIGNGLEYHEQQQPRALGDWSA